MNAYDDMLRTMDRIKDGRIDGPYVHSMRVTPHEIQPRGWTRIWRTDGAVVVYISRWLYDAMPKQQYGGLPLLVWDDPATMEHRLLAVPVYMEGA